MFSWMKSIDNMLRMRLIHSKVIVLNLDTILQCNLKHKRPAQFFSDFYTVHAVAGVYINIWQFGIKNIDGVVENNFQ